MGVAFTPTTGSEMELSAVQANGRMDDRPAVRAVQGQGRTADFRIRFGFHLFFLAVPLRPQQPHLRTNSSPVGHEGFRV